MIVAVLELETHPGKRKELLQAFGALVQPTRGVKGCIRCRVYGELANENAFLLVLEWETRKGLDRYLASDTGKVLLGAIHALCASARVAFSTALSWNTVERMGSRAGADV
ncbi:MAG: antibiotic biosynthesis monooxygenase family protein [bacterium]